MDIFTLRRICGHVISEFVFKMDESLPAWMWSDRCIVDICDVDNTSWFMYWYHVGFMLCIVGSISFCNLRCSWVVGNLSMALIMDRAASSPEGARCLSLLISLALIASFEHVFLHDYLPWSVSLVYVSILWFPPPTEGRNVLVFFWILKCLTFVSNMLTESIGL
jgi:hypothetical protein